MHAVAGEMEKLIATVLNQAREHGVRRARSYDSHRRIQNLSETEPLGVIVHLVRPLLRDFRGQLLSGETACQSSEKTALAGAEEDG